LFHRSTLLPAFTFIALLPAMAVPAPVHATSGNSANALTLAVADLIGDDGERGRFLADSLLTALGQSDRLRLVECSEVRHALAELKLGGTGGLEPEQVRHLGQKLRADLIVVGSYMESGDHLIINARVVDVPSGRPAPGCAGSAEGSDHEMLALVQGLARQIQDRVVENAPSRRPEVARATEETPDGVVSEGELATLVTRLAQDGSTPASAAFTVQHPGAPVTRLRALAALVKLVVTPNEPAPPSAAEAMPPDASQYPTWSKPLVAVAVEEGWWNAGEPLGAKEKATWAFVNALVARMPFSEEAPAGGPFSGVIIDARSLNPQRAMGPRILDEDGALLYPDPKHVRVPSADELQNDGMVSYTMDEKDPCRAGQRPLIVPAVSVSGLAREDLVVSRDAAQQIREANRRFRFFPRRAVTILIGPRSPRPNEEPSAEVP
jgi:TolB-like protein